MIWLAAIPVIALLALAWIRRLGRKKPARRRSAAERDEAREARAERRRRLAEEEKP